MSRRVHISAQSAFFRADGSYPCFVSYWSTLFPEMVNGNWRTALKFLLVSYINPIYPQTDYSAWYLVYVGIFLCFFFDFEDGDMFLRNVGWLWTDYTALYPRRHNSSKTVSHSFYFVTSLNAVLKPDLAQLIFYIVSRNETKIVQNYLFSAASSRNTLTTIARNVQFNKRTQSSTHFHKRTCMRIVSFKYFSRMLAQIKRNNAYNLKAPFIFVAISFNWRVCL
jgi:hypothetical protein